ncbi:MAG: hypothetical protein ACRD4U_07345 [Candidatus Acidiferrales bacterium]
MKGYCLPIARARRVLLLARQARVRLDVHAALEAAGCRVVSRQLFRPSDLTRYPPYDLVLADPTLFAEPHRMDLLRALRDAFCRSRFVLLLDSDNPWLREAARAAGFPAVLDYAADPAAVSTFARDAVYSPAPAPAPLLFDLEPGWATFAPAFPRRLL